MHTRSNRVAPVVEHGVSDGGNTSLDDRNIRRPPFKGILKEMGQQHGTDIRCEKRNDPTQFRERMDNGHYPTGCFLTNQALQKKLPETPYYHINNGDIGLFGPDSRLMVSDPMRFPNGNVSTLQRDLPRNPHHPSSVSPQEGDRWCASCLENERAIYEKPQKKNSVAPICPSCHQLTMRVFPDDQRSLWDIQTGGGGSSSVPSSQDQQPSLQKSYHPATHDPVKDCTEYLKCFVCTCPAMQGRTVSQHYYALSVICWLAIILTIIIVIAATVLHGGR